jgi:glycosyltransferase involved in cell wall biosynthesis
VKLAVLGRGTRKARLLDRPLARMGLQDTVFPLGYLREGYREALAMFDAGMMIVPGSDGACRAAMQLAAMAKPLVVAQRGVLPDIVLDGRTGIVVDDTPEKLAEALLTLAGTPAAERAEWGKAARCRMCEEFSLERQVSRVEAIYRKLLD